MRRNLWLCAALCMAFFGVQQAALAASRAPTTTTFYYEASNDILLGTSGGGGSSGTADQNCTNQNSSTSQSNQGILTEIETYLKQLVDEAMVKLYNAITGDGRFTSAVTGALTLFIIIFGIAFMIGLVQLTYGQVLVRIFKIAIIVAVTSPMGWSFFNDTAVKFFRDGSDDIIRHVISQTSGMGGGGGGKGSPVFTELDKIAQNVIKPETIAKVLAAVTTGPYGLAMGGLMMIATIAFIKLLVDALKTYAISYVARALLFGLAPFFIVFLLFERTKNYFTTWVNAVLNFSLQPVLLFIMLAFMMSLIDQAAKDMLGTEVCWAEFQGSEGSPNKMQFWRFAQNGQVDPSEYDWQGQVSCQVGAGGGGGGGGGAGGAGGGGNCKPFPIDIVDILSFVFLIFLASRFAQAIEPITAQLTQIYLTLDHGSRMEQFLQRQNQSIGRAVSGAAGRAAPTQAPRGGTDG